MRLSFESWAAHISTLTTKAAKPAVIKPRCSTLGCWALNIRNRSAMPWWRSTKWALGRKGVDGATLVAAWRANCSS